ncbi:MAG: 50S ribosomal protein L13 [Verrucomicrobiales bacterium]|nr:50S ribosomal protein L13 [Verrucomicrobiales bacterium]
MKTFSAKAEDIQRKWYVIDAANRVLGDVAVQAANLLRGKNKATYTPHIDNGDFVVVINADKVELTGKKETQKLYRWFTGYVGGHHETTPKQLRAADKPEKMIYSAVRGMIPHNRLGRQIYGKLRVYKGTEHPHTAQNPQQVQF